MAKLLTFSCLHTQRQRLRADQRKRLRFDDEFVHDGVQKARVLQRVKRIEEVGKRAQSAVLKEESMDVRVAHVRERSEIDGRIDGNLNPASERVWLRIFQAKLSVEFAQLKHASGIGKRIKLF